MCLHNDIAESIFGIFWDYYKINSHVGSGICGDVVSVICGDVGSAICGDIARR